MVDGVVEILISYFLLVVCVFSFFDSYFFLYLKGVKKKYVLFVSCSNNAYFLVNIIFNIFIEYILHV